jgi:hypothetical protein
MPQSVGFSAFISTPVDAQSENNGIFGNWTEGEKKVGATWRGTRTC